MRQLVESARGGSVRAASRLISLLEDDPTRLPELFAGMANWPEPRLVVGITGAPGVGKSTLCDAILRSYRTVNARQRPLNDTNDGLKPTMLGVIAVDPSSPFTGGAVLGDRIRMMEHATDERIFIRSLASRGHLGGLTLGIKGAVRVMGLMGCEVVLIETVGVGQSEVEVAGVADMTVIALAPGQGDGVQLLKAGLMEAGDIFVVNKADRPGAERLYAELVATLSLTGGMVQNQEHTLVHSDTHVADLPADGAEVFRVSAADGTGVDALVAGIEARAVRQSGQIAARRAKAMVEEVRHSILEAARVKLDRALGANGTREAKIENVLAGKATVNGLARELMKAALAVDDDSPQRHRGTETAQRRVKE